MPPVIKCTVCSKRWLHDSKHLIAWLTNLVWQIVAKTGSEKHAILFRYEVVGENGGKYDFNIVEILLESNTKKVNFIFGMKFTDVFIHACILYNHHHFAFFSPWLSTDPSGRAVGKPSQSLVWPCDVSARIKHLW